MQGELQMSASKYRGVLHCLLTVARHEGILGLQKGLVAGPSPRSHESRIAQRVLSASHPLRQA